MFRDSKLGDGFVEKTVVKRVLVACSRDPLCDTFVGFAIVPLNILDLFVQT